METSALHAYLAERRPTFDQAAYQAALESDWRRGRPEEIAEYDCKMGLSGGVIRTADSYEGYVGTLRFDKTQLSEFRSIRRNGSPTWREVVAKDVDGKVWYVGKLRLAMRNDYGVPRPARLPDLPLDTTRPVYPPRGS